MRGGTEARIDAIGADQVAQPGVRDEMLAKPFWPTASAASIICRRTRRASASPAARWRSSTASSCSDSAIPNISQAAR